MPARRHPDHGGSARHVAAQRRPIFRDDGLSRATASTRRVHVEYTFFTRYDLQPPLTFTYPLDGSVG
jgi:hypothetical protein